MVGSVFQWAGAGEQPCRFLQLPSPPLGNQRRDLAGSARQTVQSFAALEPVMKALGVWAQQNIEAEVALADTLASPMMWRCQSVLQVSALPETRLVIRFHFRDEPSDYDTFWFLVQRGTQPELCIHDPKLDVDLYVETTVVAMGGIIVGRTTLAKETQLGSFFSKRRSPFGKNISRLASTRTLRKGS